MESTDIIVVKDPGGKERRKERKSKDLSQCETIKTNNKLRRYVCEFGGSQMMTDLC